MKNSFICYYCKENKPLSEIKKDTLVYVKRDDIQKGKCVPCHREYSRQYSIRNRAVIMPHNFMDCDDCDRTFSIYETGSAKIHGIRMKRTRCPFCQSEEIVGHKEGA